MRKFVVIAAVAIALIGGWFFSMGSQESETVERGVIVQVEQDAEVESDNNTLTEVEVAATRYSIDDEDSLWLVVNKDRPISLEYIPDNLRLVEVLRREDKSQSELSMRDDAASALERMFKAAKKEGVDLLLGSGYRDADLQNVYYTNYVANFGQAEADKFSARPGTSEHQIGLVADVSPASRNCYLDECFAKTVEGKWVAENAHRFGFIIRYPEGKESITGYQFEPWHVRFVGEELAEELYSTNQTMEEYFSL